MASRIGRIFETALLPLGVVAIGVLIWQIGPDERAEIVRLLTTIRWWFVAIILQEIVAHAANTAGLLACLPRDRGALGFWYAFAARLAGEGVNATMPTATVGGELLKISLLSRRAPADRVTAGITAAYATQALAQMLFTTLALPLALPALTLPPSFPSYSKGLIVLFVLGGLVATFWFANVTRVGSFFGKTHWVFQKVGLGQKGSRTHAATSRIDDAARDAQTAAPSAFFVSVLEFLVGWTWGIAEVAIVIYACTGQVSLVQCLTIEALSSFVDAVFFFVPGQMGTREVGLTAITQALGLGAPLGISIGLIRRGRVLVWAAVGILCLAWFRRTAQPESPPETVSQTNEVTGEKREHSEAPEGPSVVRESSAG